MDISTAIEDYISIFKDWSDHRLYSTSRQLRGTSLQILRNKPTHLAALVTRLWMWSDQIRVWLKVRPRCLGLVTSLIITPWSVRIGSGILFTFLDIFNLEVVLKITFRITHNFLVFAYPASGNDIVSYHFLFPLLPNCLGTWLFKHAICSSFWTHYTVHSSYL